MLKFFGTVFGMFLLSLVLLLFYWTQWEDDSEAHAEHVVQNVNVMERFWNRESRIGTGNLKFGYKEVVRTGFPFGMTVRLVQPYLIDRQNDTKFTLTTAYLDFVPSGSIEQPYTIEYPADGHAIIERSGQKIAYYLHLSSLPGIDIRKTKVAGRQSSAFNEYGITYPPGLILKAARDQKLQQYPVTFTSTEEPVWRPMVRLMRENMTALRRLLQRGMTGL